MSVENNIKCSGKKVELGRKGEEIASGFLEDKGYIIIKRNYMIGHSDIDILARNKEFLVFVEVRTKSKKDRGMPEDTLTKKKLHRMKNTAELYIAFNHYEGLARLDAVCIILDDSDHIKHLEHYEGVG
ncbi:MAG: YraN family protein [Spirochaetales bacterium]|nr:YraN family protein [Spirochaetales bacterium]